MQALPAITLSENQPQNVSLPIGVTAVQLHNASVGFLTVNISGDSTYVGPQSWVTIPVGGQTASMTLTLLDASAGSVYATVFMATDGDLANTLVSGSLNQQQVTLESGTVTISGTPTVDLANDASVTISGTPTVELASGASVAISGTPTIVIQSGSVNINGGQLKNSVGVALQPTSDQLLISDLGDGSAGAVTFGTNSLLTSDLQATSITVPSGVTLSSGGYRIRCQGTCLVDGIVENWGNGSTTAGVEPPGATGTLIGGQTGVVAYSDNAYAPVVYGISAASASLEGGGGGYGGSAYGGTTSASIASPTISTLHNGSLSGGASGGAYSPGNGAGGYSGSAGGVILVLCSEIAGSGRLGADGGNAAINGNASAGGGGGGVVIVACYSNNFTGVLTVTPGNGAGADASSGDAGTAIIMVTT